jgi:2-succinyl-5-enolpyruvyl-6-hydroxy-3-cyclohexene-1-carboxylate synthase
MAELTRDLHNVVVFGRPTLSREIAALLARPELNVTVVAPAGGPWPDAARNASHVVGHLSERWLHPSGDPTDQSEFAARWAAASSAAGAVLDDVTAQPDLAGPFAAIAVARAVARAAGRTGVPLVVGASSPIRDLDLVAGLAADPDSESATDQAEILSNRGLAGIDGVISTASGVALARSAARGLVGDLTFLHDVGGLMTPRGGEVPNLQIVVENDRGGSIFEGLEHGRIARQSPARQEAFERLFATAHDVDIASICAGYSVGHTLATDLNRLERALADGPSGVEVVEVPTSRQWRFAQGDELRDRIVSAAMRSIGATSP